MDKDKASIPVYYTENPKHYCASNYNIGSCLLCDHRSRMLYAVPNRYIEAPKYYTIEGKLIRIQG
jgi:hypothetical protein